MAPISIAPTHDIDSMTALVDDLVRQRDDARAERDIYREQLSLSLDHLAMAIRRQDRLGQVVTRLTAALRGRRA